MRLKSRALRSRPDRSHATQDFVVPARNASTSAANPDAAIPTKTPAAMLNFILPADLPAILDPSRRCPLHDIRLAYQTDAATRRVGKIAAGMTNEDTVAGRFCPRGRIILRHESGTAWAKADPVPSIDGSFTAAFAHPTTPRYFRPTVRF